MKTIAPIRSAYKQPHRHQLKPVAADGAYAPTPFAGTIYIIDAHRVHVVDAPFTKAIKTISRWGEGAKDLVAHLEKEKEI